MVECAQTAGRMSLFGSRRSGQDESWAALGDPPEAHTTCRSLGTYPGMIRAPDPLDLYQITSGLGAALC